MLITCPECSLQVSDRASSCPHCGYPIKNQPEKRKYNKRRKRLPNGFGQISELKSQNLRKPFRAMVSVGKKENGRPICKLLQPEAYFATYNEAYAALVEYNKNPFDFNEDITCQELYDQWTSVHFKQAKAASSIRNIKSSWKKCSHVYNIKVKQLKIKDIKYCMTIGDGNEPTPGAKLRIKQTFNTMLDYAVENEIVSRNVSREFKISDDIMDSIKASRNSHIIFTDEEMDVLWKNKNIPIVAAILIQCYTGWRPQELTLIRTDNTNIIDWTMTGGMKTEAGHDRQIPIHSAIQDIVKIFYDEAKNKGHEYLISMDGHNINYDQYKGRFIRVMKRLGLSSDHKPHDPRKHFITMAKNADVNDYAVKRIVGHFISDVTESVYTIRPMSWLRSEIEKISVGTM